MLRATVFKLPAVFFLCAGFRFISNSGNGIMESCLKKIASRVFAFETTFAVGCGEKKNTLFTKLLMDVFGWQVSSYLMKLIAVNEDW